MSSYKVSEPSALKFLKANGAVVDENGNVVNESSDYWKNDMKLEKTGFNYLSFFICKITLLIFKFINYYI